MRYVVRNVPFTTGPLKVKRGADGFIPGRLRDVSLFIDDVAAPVIDGCVLVPHTSCRSLNHFADLSRAWLPGIDLTGANLRYVNLSGANLSRANLTSVDLEGANLTGVNMSAVNLSGANLNDAKLLDALMAGARLTGTHFGNADLTGAYPIGANLNDADLSFRARPKFCRTHMPVPAGWVNNTGC